MSEKNKAILEATLSVKDDLTGSLGIPVERIYPDLEDVTIKPSTEEQKWKSKMYGYNEITVEPVTSEIDEDIQSENIRAGTNILGVEGKETVVDTEDATAMAENILEGQTAYIKGEKIDGSIETYDGSFEGIAELPDENLYLCRVVDYDSTIIKEAWLTPGSVFTMPDEPQHDGLIFDGWSSPVDIINNTVLVEDQDLIIGPMYDTKSGACEYTFNVNKHTTLTISLGSHYNRTSVDWGDGTIDNSERHTYAKYGDYTIRVFGATNIPDRILRPPVSSYVKHVRFSSSVEKLYESAVSDSYSLETVTMPFGITKPIKIYRCTCMKAFVIPSSMTGVLPEYFAMSDLKLQHIVIPKGITGFLRGAFQTCRSLEYISLPKGTVEIGKTAFKDTSLRRIKIPELATKIASDAFQGCSPKMKELVFPEDAYNDENKFTVSGITSLEKVKFPKSMTNYESVISGTSIEEFDIPEGVTNIDGIAYNCKDLKRLGVPKSVTEITRSTFYDTYSLETVDLPDTVTYLGTQAFYYSKITHITLPASLERLSDMAFYNCADCVFYDFSKCRQIPVLENTNVFGSLNYAARMVVPDELYDEWITATNWSTYADKINKASGEV